MFCFHVTFTSLELDKYMMIHHTNNIGNTHPPMRGEQNVLLRLFDFLTAN